MARSTAMTALTSGAVLEQAAAGPRGLYWVPMPHRQRGRLDAHPDGQPAFRPGIGTLGPNIPKEGLECASVPYPVLITYHPEDVDLDYNMLKAVVSQIDNFKAAEPSASGWAADKQVFGWVIPFSAGAIRYWTEIGMWDDAKQAHNDALMKRQQVMLEAWKRWTAWPKRGFAEKWLDVRAKALTEAGFNPYFQN